MSRKESASACARRLLALMHHLQRGAVLSVSALSGATGTSEAQVLEDLAVLQMCGLPPYSPDVLIDIEIRGDFVKVWSDPQPIRRPVRLSWSEARALTSALEACGVEPGDALLSKLEAACSPPEAEDIVKTVRSAASPAPRTQGVLAAAVERAQSIRLRYLSADGESGVRVVHPYSLANHQGRWYLTAFCESAGDLRLFRLDRVLQAEPTGAVFERPDPAPRLEPGDFDARSLPKAVIRFFGAAPPESPEFPGSVISTTGEGTVQASVPYSSMGWLSRKIAARLGGAEVVAPEGLRRKVAETARAVIAEQ